MVLVLIFFFFWINWIFDFTQFGHLHSYEYVCVLHISFFFKNICMCRGVIGGKTGNTMVLSWFCKIENDSGAPDIILSQHRTIFYAFNIKFEFKYFRERIPVNLNLLVSISFSISLTVRPFSDSVWVLGLNQKSCFGCWLALGDIPILSDPIPYQKDA